MNPLGLPVACSAWLINVKIHLEHLTPQLAGLQVSVLIFPLQAAANRDRIEKSIRGERSVIASHKRKQLTGMAGPLVPFCLSPRRLAET